MRIVSQQVFQTATCWLFLHELISGKPMAPSSKESIPVFSRDLSSPRQQQQPSLRQAASFALPSGTTTAHPDGATSNQQPSQNFRDLA